MHNTEYTYIQLKDQAKIYLCIFENAYIQLILMGESIEFAIIFLYFIMLFFDPTNLKIRNLKLVIASFWDPYFTDCHLEARIWKVAAVPATATHPGAVRTS